MNPARPKGGKARKRLLPCPPRALPWAGFSCLPSEARWRSPRPLGEAWLARPRRGWMRQLGRDFRASLWANPADAGPGATRPALRDSPSPCRSWPSGNAPFRKGERSARCFRCGWLRALPSRGTRVKLRQAQGCPRPSAPAACAGRVIPLPCACPCALLPRSRRRAGVQPRCTPKATRKETRHDNPQHPHSGRLRCGNGPP